MGAMNVKRTAELAEAGLSHRQLSAGCRRGERVRVRHGAWSENAALDELDQHRRLAEGTWGLLGGNAVLSHATAAVLHGLPVWRPLLDRVAVTRPDGGHGTRTRNLVVRQAPLASVEITDLHGFRATSLERTAVDLARLVPYERAVAVLDAALQLKAEPSLLSRIVAEAAGRKGAGVARRALAFADGRAESVGESISRVRIAQVGLMPPELQFNVFDHNGIWVARTDFAWPVRGLVGEFDGAVKYTGTPAEVAAAVMKEKRREQDIIDIGWRMVRWTWSDLEDRARFGARIATALTQGRFPGRD